MTSTHTYYESMDDSIAMSLDDRIARTVNAMKKHNKIISVTKKIYEKEYIGKTQSGMDMYFPRMCKVSITYEPKEKSR